MMLKDKELREAVRLGIKTLIIQEVRLLRLERAFTPTLVMDEMARSIQETKKTIIKLTRAIKDNERTALLKRMIHQAVDEEIDRAIELRKTRCIRCLHGRFYDEAGIAHVNLPVRTQVKTIGCDKLRPNLKRNCKRFVEMSIADSMDHYLNEMTLLYEFRELIDRIEEIWKDYLTK
jgi:hypothetical protein